MKKAALISVFCFLAYINGYSQARQESVKELFQLMQMDSQTDKMFESIMPAMLNQMPGQPGDPTSKARLNEMMTSSMQSVKEISKRMINEDMVVLYAKYYTQGEINDLISFYKTPTAQKLIKTMPEIQKEMMVIMMQKYMPEMQKSMPKMEQRK